jgi:hypothetical protein
MYIDDQVGEVFRALKKTVFLRYVTRCKTAKIRSTAFFKAQNISMATTQFACLYILHLTAINIYEYYRNLRGCLSLLPGLRFFSQLWLDPTDHIEVLFLVNIFFNGKINCHPITVTICLRVSTDFPSSLQAITRNPFLHLRVATLFTVFTISFMFTDGTRFPCRMLLLYELRI